MGTRRASVVVTADMIGWRKSYRRDGKLVHVDHDRETITVSPRALFGGNAEARSDADRAAGPDTFGSLTAEPRPTQGSADLAGQPRTSRTPYVGAPG